MRPGYDAAVETPLREFFDRHSTVSFGNYPVRRSPRRAHAGRPCVGRLKAPLCGRLKPPPAYDIVACVEIRGVFIEDTFAEAFGMRAARVVITARTMRWARAAALKLTGFATSVIACKCEAAIERELTPDETPDARPGVSALLFTMDTDSLGKRLTERIGQTVLTCPTASCFDGLPDAPDRLPAARALRTFGDRFQISKVVDGERYWRVPVMEGECLLQESFGMQKKGVGGGNFLILAEDVDSALDAAEAAVAAIDGMPGVILPFPGGVVRSGSKVGSRGYKGMIASTNDAYCPTLRPLTASAPARRRQRGAGDRARRAVAGCDPAPRCAPASTPRAGPACGRSPPATTAASSGRITSTCARSWERRS